jgi:Zn-dependent peptidase ImmA (M78 family)
MFTVAELHDDLSVDCSQRIDVFSCIRQLGIQLMFRPLNRCAGIYVPGADGTPGILIHWGHPAALQRYSASHELGHHVFNHGHQFDRGEVVPRSTSNVWDSKEMLAEAFAAWFLMPPELVDSALSVLNISRPKSPHDAYALALRLGTSYTATCVHLNSLGLMHRDEMDACLKTRPKEIKKSLIQNHTLKDWRRDVWVITRESQERRLTVNRGDRVVIAQEGKSPSQDHLPFDALGVVKGKAAGSRWNDQAFFDVPTDDRGGYRIFELIISSGDQKDSLVQIRTEPSYQGLFVEDEVRPDKDLRRVRISLGPPG